MGMHERLDVLNKAKDRIKQINFGDPVTNVCAGEGNPNRLGFFCEYKIKTTKNRFKVEHKTHLARCTDGHGKFWEADIEIIFAGHLGYEKCTELFKPIWSAHYE